MIDYASILTTHYPNTVWSIVGSEYSGLQWNDISPKPSKTELDNLWYSTQQIYAKNECKIKAKNLLQKTDWVVLSDVELVNKSDFISYRNTLRNLIINPVAEPEWPTEPEPVWS